MRIKRCRQNRLLPAQKIFSENRPAIFKPPFLYTLKQYYLSQAYQHFIKPVPHIQGVNGLYIG
ncbi:MAG: hypothetical protein RIQ78_1138 [Bacteroidota bacterium]|jgi:hypothetical protein